MIVVIAFLIGAALGAWHAKRQNGNRKDMFQYALSYGLIFAVIGMFITIYLLRAG